MKYIQAILLVITVSIMTGCVGTSLQVQRSYVYDQSDTFSYEIIDNANVTTKGMSIFKDRLNSQFNKMGLSNTKPNKIVEITFSNYHMRPGASRALVGIMAGADNITSMVTIKEKGTNNIVGSFQVISKNPTATSSARGLIEQHADEIVNYIKFGEP
jgi:hypothetical protein